MKAISINLDPYLAQIADWLDGATYDEDSGTYSPPPPTFDPLPLAVTIPLGEDVCIFGPGDEDHIGLSFSVDGKDILVCSNEDGGPAFPTVPTGESLIGTTTEKFSAYATGEDYSTVSVYSVSGNKVDFPLYLFYNDFLVATIPFTVLVRRETASGPVDLVDFTPPAAAPTAAQINEILSGATDPLDGVSLGGAKIIASGEVGSTVVLSGASGTAPYNLNLAADNAQTLGIASES